MDDADQLEQSDELTKSVLKFGAVGDDSEQNLPQWAKVEDSSPEVEPAVV